MNHRAAARNPSVAFSRLPQPRRPTKSVIALAAIWTATGGALVASPSWAASHQPGAELRCSQMRSLALENTVITETKWFPAGVKSPWLFPAAGPTPAHCMVIGEINGRSGVTNPDTGSDHYGVRFRLALPDSWNGRFFYQGGGGADGYLNGGAGLTPSQAKATQIPALWRGYAVVTSDGGHDSGITPLASTLAGFGVDPIARIDYGYASIGQVTPIAKALTTDYYHRPIDRSYFVGCSKGGQEALQTSQRYGDQFDGIIAGDPGYRLPHAAVAEAYITQTLATAAAEFAPGQVDQSSGEPLLSAALPRADLNLVIQGVLKACDGLDGLQDGMIFNPQACAGRFDPVSLQCPGAKNASCLAPAQVTALQKIFGPIAGADGSIVYPNWPYDTGLISTGIGGWTTWRLGVYGLPVNLAFNTTLGQSSLSYVFSTPPDPSFDIFSIDLATLEQSIYATGTDPVTGVVYNTAPVDFMEATSTNLDALHGHGGKLIVYHGESDPIFSMNDTVAYFDRLNSAYGASTADFARLFLVPGMNHCLGGKYSANSFDSLTALVDWVENSKAPDSMIASPGNDPGVAYLPLTLTRPLCAYPKYAAYQGGDPNSAASFACVSPASPNKAR